MRALAAILIAGCSSSSPPPATTPVGGGGSATPPAVAASVCIAGTGGVRLGEITATGVQFCFDTYGDAEEPTTTCYLRDVRSGVVTSTPPRALPKVEEPPDAPPQPDGVLAVDDKRGLVVQVLDDALTVAVKTKAGKVQAKFKPEVEPTLARFVPAGILFTFQAAGPGSDAAFHALDGKLISRVGGPVKEDGSDYMNLYTAGQNPIDLADGRYVFLDAGGDFIALHAASGKFERRVVIAPPDSKTRELSEEEMMDADIGGHDSMALLPDGKLAVVRGFPRYGSISLVDLSSGTSTHLPAPERCVKPAAAPAN